MNKAIASVLAGAAMVAFAAGAANAEDLEFELINDTDYDIVEFQVSATAERTWSSNLMPRGYVLPAGNSIDVEIEDGRRHCEYDIKAVFDDGDEVVEFDVDVCDLGRYTFTQ